MWSCNIAEVAVVSKQIMRWSQVVVRLALKEKLGNMVEFECGG